MVPRYLYPALSVITLVITAIIYHFVHDTAVLLYGVMVQLVMSTMVGSIIIRNGYDTHGLLSEQISLLIGTLRASGMSVVTSHADGREVGKDA